MCGIAGFYGAYTEADLVGMAAAIAHRGPDGERIEIRPGRRESDVAGLAHRRLSIIDIDGGAQPMWSSDGRYCIVFNGEIYNYASLRQELAAEGARFSRQSDTEVIVEGWRVRGPAILPALAGMFAFGIWDDQEKLWIFARDRAGIKPLYYALPQPGRIAFASEIKPLLPLIGTVAPDMGALYNFLLYSWNVGPQTIFKGVRHLPPGYWAIWRPGDQGLDARPFSEPSQARSRLGFADAARELEARFDDAIRSHMVSDVPVGITLSGGLDSSAVLSGMTRLAEPGSIDAFTIEYGLADDETPFARTMAAHAGVAHHVRTVSRERIPHDFERLVRTIEEPMGHPVLQTTLEMAAAARDKLKVVLVGEGSDELFLGYPQYKLLTLPFSLAPATMLQSYYLAVTCLMPKPAELAAMLTPVARDGAAFDTAAQRFDPYFRSGDAVGGAQRFEMENSLVANQLMRIDKLTMAHGLEARVPFLDNQLVDFARTLPLAHKLRGGVTKAIFREAMRRRLPPDILHRPKTGKRGTQALLPYLNGLVTNGPLSHLISREAIGRRGWLDPDKVRTYLAQASSPLVKAHPIESRRRTKFAYSLAVLEQWARIYLD
jgi:asparagine synthase (glutamine-hydrolysing)